MKLTLGYFPFQSIFLANSFCEKIQNKVKTLFIYLSQHQCISVAYTSFRKHKKIYSGFRGLNFINLIEIRLKDLFTFHGRISRANYRALSLLAIGVSICVFFLPSLIFKLTYRWNSNNIEISLASTESLMPMVYLVCYPIIILVMLMLSMKRIRDTGNSIWKLILPVYNLKLLYFVYSKK